MTRIRSLLPSLIPRVTGMALQPDGVQVSLTEISIKDINQGYLTGIKSLQEISEVMGRKEISEAEHHPI